MVTLGPAQTTWTNVASGTPSTRWFHALAYDSFRGRVVLFGGVLNSVAYADTWEWDGNTWTQRNPAVAPSARQGAAMVYDSARRRVVLFGGNPGGVNAPKNDTWEWDGSSWTLRNPAVSPPARVLHAMAYDSARAVTVLFSGASQLSDLWEWDGTNWTQRLPSFGPPAQGAHALAYDSLRRRVVLFGGDASLYVPDTTWEWDGASWYRRVPATSPPARAYFAMAYDEARGRTVAFGGMTATTMSLSDTWEWDGVDWVQRNVPTSPNARTSHAMAYDSKRGRMLLWGGRSLTPAAQFNDTWEYAPLTPARFAPFGLGCAGAGGVPALAAAPGSLPWLGDTFSATLTNLGPNPALHVPFVLLGDSKTAWGTFPLPLDLTPIGMPGCSLYASPLVTYPLVNGAGSATWSVPVPNVAAYAGISLYVQGGATSPGTNSLGIVMSNACEMGIGAR